MAKRLAELGALQDAVSNDESSPKRLALAGYIRGLFLDWSANPYNPLSRLTARGRLLGYFWDSGAIGLSMNFADQNYLVKDGTVQSKSFSQIVNFSRTTNATVTNSAGQITYAPHNLLTYSEQFDNAAWTKSQSTITANAIISPDGTNTADKLVETAVNNVHGISVITTGAGANSTSTFSIYAQKAERSKIRVLLTDNATGGVECVFDLNAGTAGAVSVSGNYASGSALITASTNGFYRCSVTATKNASGNTSNVPIVQLYTTTQTYLGDGTSGAYIWGAQLEVGASPTTYNPTTVKNLLGYSELFDNAAWTKSNSFVQTNLLKYSEDFSVSASWNAASGITANTTIAPNGYQTADTIDVALAIPFQQVTCTASTVYTYSVYIQLGTLSAANFKFAVRDDTAGVFIAQDIVPTQTPTASGWTRITYTFTTPVGCVAVRPYLYRNTGAGITGTFYAWGAQLVQGSVAGDYRRTDAAALPVYYPNHNGVVCAERIVPDSANVGSHRISQTSPTVTGGIYTYSIYAKADGYSWLKLRLNTIYANFNLSTGVTGVTNGTSSSIQSLGNGWYRCSVTKTATGNNELAYAYVANSNNAGLDSDSFAGDGTSGIYIFGAQLSDSASLDPYVLNAAAAPTAAAYYGARFDYDPVTLLPKGLLIEEQRANLFLQSGFAGAVAGTPGTAPTSWAFVLSGGTTNAITTDGTGGNILSYSATAARHFVSQTTAISASTTYVASLYINSNTGAVYQSIFSISSTPAGATVTYFANGASVNNATYVPLAGDRLTAVIVNSTTAGNVVTRIGIGCSNNDTGTVSFSKPQLEAGSFATSYIPTAASQVTRAADVATIQGSNFYSWYNQNEGSIVTNASASSNGFTFSCRDSTGGSYLASINRASSTAFEAYANGVVQASLGTSALVSKTASGYKVNDFATSINNSSVSTDTSGITPIVSFSTIGNFASNSQVINGTIKSISYYPQRLSDSVLKGLTA